MAEGRVNFGFSAVANTFGFWTFFDTNIISTVENILNYSDGVDTGWDITLTNIFAGTSGTGVNAVGSGDAVWVDEAIISQQYFYIDTGTNTAALTISNLDNAKTYDIEVFASRDVTATNRHGEYTVDGFSTLVDLNAEGNSTITGLFSGVSPSTGNIVVDVRLAAGSGFAYVNAIRITEVVSVVAAITSVGGDDVVLDAETPAFITTGFSSEISTVQLVSGTSTTNGSSVSSTSGTGTFVLPDITGYVVDTVGCPLTTANNVVVARLTDA